MKNKKIFITVILCVLILLFSCACGITDAPSTNETQATVVSTQSTSGFADEPIDTPSGNESVSDEPIDTQSTGSQLSEDTGDTQGSLSEDTDKTDPKEEVDEELEEPLEPQVHVCSFSQKRIIKEPTCTELGERIGRCSCGEERTEEIFKLGHSCTTVTVAPTCVDYGYTGNTCIRCGAVFVSDKISATGHKYENGECCSVCGKHIAFEFKLSDDGTYYIVARLQSSEELNQISIPSEYGGLPVKAIGANAFSSKKKLKKVVIPEGVTQIDQYAFGNCSGLTEVILPSTLVSIGANAFSRCASLESIDLPSGLEIIGHNAFYSNALKKIILPDGCCEIYSGAFSNCATDRKSVV